MMKTIKQLFLCSILLLSISCSDKGNNPDTSTKPTAQEKMPDKDTITAKETLRKLSESARTYYAEPTGVAQPTQPTNQGTEKPDQWDSDAWKALDFAMTDPHDYAHNFVADSEQLSIFIDSVGNISIRGKAVKLSQLAERLQKEHEQTPSLQLVIHVDKKTLHGQVVKVMDVAKSAGVEKIALKNHGEEIRSVPLPPAN